MVAGKVTIDGVACSVQAVDACDQAMLYNDAGCNGQDDKY